MAAVNSTIIAVASDEKRIIKNKIKIKRIIRMEVASSRPDYLPTLSAAKTSKLSLLVKHHILAIDEAI